MLLDNSLDALQRLLLHANVSGKVDCGFQPEFGLAIGAGHMYMDARFFS